MAEAISRRVFPLHLRPLDEREQLFTDIRRHNLLGLHQLLERDPDLNLPHPEHGYPIIYAVRIGFLDTLEALFQFHADLNVKQNGTALHAAVSESKGEIIDFLLSNGADTSVTNDAGETPLFLAIRANDIETATKLLDHNSPLNTVNAQGDSPLTVAIGQKRQDFVKLLLDRGAEPNGEGRHPLQTARELNLVHIVNILRLAGAKEAVRRPHSSKQQVRRRDGRMEGIVAREELLSLQEEGYCYLCGTTESLIKVLPCGHAVVCPACVELFCDRLHQCPVCKLNFFATTK
jgi:ankyrin repeat protein